MSRLTIEGTDRAIARALQGDARITNAEIGKLVGLAQSSAHERVRRLEAAGHIEGCHERIDPSAFGLGMTDGEDCFLVKLWAPDNEMLGRILRQDFGAAGARSTRTTIVLETLLDRPGPLVPEERNGDGSETP